MSSKSQVFAIRLDHATIEKLQRLAQVTDRTRGSVIRTLIQIAEIGSFADVAVPQAPQTGSRTEETTCEANSATRNRPLPETDRHASKPDTTCTPRATHQ